MSAPSINNVIGKRFIELLSVDSTNNYAMRQVQDGLATGEEAYFAFEQTAGKGQLNKKWITAKGENIILSIVIDTSKLQLQQQFTLNMITAISALQLFNNYSPEEAKIKWPNDIYWRDRKAGGILIENLIRGKNWQFAIIGIGMNINQTVFDSNLINPVSLKQITGKTYNVVELAKEFCILFNENCNALLQTDNNLIIKKYNAELYRLNEIISFKLNNQIYSGTVKSVDEFGELILEVENEEMKLLSGSVEWIIPS